MSTTAFKGVIKTGTIAAKFLSDFSNIDSDIVVLTFVPIGGGAPQIDRAVTAPGGSATGTLSPATNGMLEILVATGQAADSGRLEVTRNGSPVDQDSVQGSVRWIYSVEP